MHFPFITIHFCFVDGGNLLRGCSLIRGWVLFPTRHSLAWLGAHDVLCISHPNLVWFECKLTPLGWSRTTLGLERMRPYHTSARRALFGASDPKGRRRLGSPQVHELPNFYHLFPGSPPADAKPVVHVGGEEMNVRAVRSATSQVICTEVWGFSSSSFSRQSCLPSTAFLGHTFADVCRQTCACPACTPSCLALTQGRSWKPCSCISTAQCPG